MDYRGIITQGYHSDAGGQIAIRIISQGYIGTLATIQQIFNTVEHVAYFQVTRIKDMFFGGTQTSDSKFTSTRNKEVLF